MGLRIVDSMVERKAVLRKVRRELSSGFPGEACPACFLKPPWPGPCARVLSAATPGIAIKVQRAAREMVEQRRIGPGDGVPTPGHEQGIWALAGLQLTGQGRGASRSYSAFLTAK